LNEYEDSQRRRLKALQTAKHHEKERLAAEMEAMCAQYRIRIAGAGQEVERERDLFREWQERKETEHRRISEAASACAPNAGRLMLRTMSGSIAENFALCACLSLEAQTKADLGRTSKSKQIAALPRR